MTCIYLIPAKYVLIVWEDRRWWLRRAAWGTSLSIHGGTYQSRISIHIVYVFFFLSFPTPPPYQVASPASLEGVLVVAYPGTYLRGGGGGEGGHSPPLVQFTTPLNLH